MRRGYLWRCQWTHRRLSLPSWSQELFAGWCSCYPSPPSPWRSLPSSKGCSETLQWAVAGFGASKKTLPLSVMSKLLESFSELLNRIQGSLEHWRGRSWLVWFVITLNGACDLILPGAKEKGDLKRPPWSRQGLVCCRGCSSWVL